MSKYRVNGLVGALLFGAFAMIPAGSSADHLGRYQVADGMTIYLGIMAAEVLRKNPDQYPYHARSEVPSGKNMYHLLVAIFDNASGERIADAEVEARVSPLGLAGPKRRLDQMSVAGAITYCNYFKLSPGETYVVRTEIRRPGVPGLVRAEFILERHSE
ncbi:MAG: hypothetical protein ACE5KF_01570 [Kiloniellaceae bacterium]